MKKERMNFIAGAGLIGVVIFSVGCSEAPTNCKNVASFLNSDRYGPNADDLTDREMTIATKIHGENLFVEQKADYEEMYARCVAIEGALP